MKGRNLPFHIVFGCYLPVAVYLPFCLCIVTPLLPSVCCRKSTNFVVYKMYMPDARNLNCNGHTLGIGKGPSASRSIF
jgi:hypothetical protein